MHAQDLLRFAPWRGFYTISFLKHYRPDVHWIDYALIVAQDLRIDDQTFCDKLDQHIRDGLTQGKIVCLLLVDEVTLPPPFDNFTMVCNRYQDEKFYLITQLGPRQQRIYTYQGGLTCKIVELPWQWLNDCAQYDYLRCKISVPKASQSRLHYLNMMNRPAPHKIDLIMALHDLGLHHHGKITATSRSSLPQSLWDTVELNDQGPYHGRQFIPDLSPAGPIDQSHGIFVSSNVWNYLAIEAQYDMPLIINAETTTGIFFMTEKSLWPALLGRMYLLYGQPHAMSLIQRFHEVDQTIYCDLDFDTMEGDWSHTAALQRLRAMLDSNRYLITHARDIYQDLRDKFAAARQTIGDRMLDFFLKQLATIR